MSGKPTALTAAVIVTSAFRDINISADRFSAPALVTFMIRFSILIFSLSNGRWTPAPEKGADSCRTDFHDIHSPIPSHTPSLHFYLFHISLRCNRPSSCRSFRLYPYRKTSENICWHMIQKNSF